MEYLLTSTVILAAVQGLTEFLPISSTAHLILVSHLLNGLDEGVFLDASVHVGSLGAIIYYCRRELFDMTQGSIETLRSKQWNKDSKLALYMVCAAIPGLAVGYLIHLLGYEEDRRVLHLIAYAQIIFGILLWLVDRVCISARRVEDLNLFDSVIIGCGQCLAFIPGASRSGSTMMIARFLGYERREAAKFSFLVAVPTIAAAGLFAFYGAYKQAGLTAFTSDILVGIAVSFVVSLASVYFLMFWLRRLSFSLFAVYRIAFGVYILYFLSA